MADNLLTCADCTTQYALELTSCPHCGSKEFVSEKGAAAKRLPLFVTVRCVCGRGPWTVRLEAKTSGLLELPTLACASCGSRVPVTWPPEEEPMSPKITVHGGATNARDTDVSPAVDASQPLVAAEGDQGRPTPEEPVAETESVQDETAPEADDVQSETAEEETGDGYEGMTLAELRALATERDLPSYGTKAQLTERLREADAS